MMVNSSFELAEIAGEFMLIPVGDIATSFKGVIALNDAAGFLLKHMSEPKTSEELVEILMGEYAVDRPTAEADVKTLLNQLLEYGVIEK